jgi:hypothetical protein
MLVRAMARRVLDEDLFCSRLQYAKSSSVAELSDLALGSTAEIGKVAGGADSEPDAQGCQSE